MREQEPIRYVESNTGLREALEHIELLMKKYASMSTDELLNHVYKNYPKNPLQH